jgi:hypothetical protein
MNHFHMWLDRLIVVDDEISPSFSLDDEGNNAVFGGRHVERGFIWQRRQCAKLRFLQSKGEPTLSTIAVKTRALDGVPSAGGLRECHTQGTFGMRVERSQLTN